MKHVDVLDLPEDARDLIRECEARGEQTVFERNGRAVAILVSYDEYLALRETIEIANDALLFAKLAERDDASSRNVIATSWERLRFAPGAEAEISNDLDAALRRIDDDPIAGAPLFEPLKGLWSYRAAGARILYKIVAEARIVVILAVERA